MTPEVTFSLLFRYFEFFGVSGSVGPFAPHKACADVFSLEFAAFQREREEIAETFWQCTFSLDAQDTFDHDKGQKSAISGRRLHWIFLIFLQWIFCLSPMDLSLFSRSMV